MPIRNFQKADIEPLTRILHATGMFRQEEIDVAVELMEIVTDEQNEDDYFMKTFEDDGGNARGYYCVGPTPMTASTFDLYWIVVDPRMQRSGIGSQLLEDCEAYVRSKHGSLIMVETSSLSKYTATKSFYERNQYKLAARIPGYYNEGDDLMIYTKHLKEN